MKAVEHAPGDPGPTGEFSPFKALGLAIGFAGVAPFVLFYLEVGPVDGAWTAFGLTVGCVLFGGGLYWGMGKGWARKLGERIRDTVGG